MIILKLGMIPAALMALLTMVIPSAKESNTPLPAVHSIYDFTVKDIDGKEVSLSEYKGKTVLIVNTASKCGFTPQYAGLEKLYNQYKDKGFVILGFPANNFLRQEPGTNSDIKQFCTLKYGVTFPMFEKISVRGSDIHPLYAYLTDTVQNPQFGGTISWNFNKFLIDGKGTIINRFGSPITPENPKLIKAIEATFPSKK